MLFIWDWCSSSMILFFSSKLFLILGWSISFRFKQRRVFWNAAAYKFILRITLRFCFFWRRFTCIFFHFPCDYFPFSHQQVILRSSLTTLISLLVKFNCPMIGLVDNCSDFLSTFDFFGELRFDYYRGFGFDRFFLSTAIFLSLWVFCFDRFFLFSVVFFLVVFFLSISPSSFHWLQPTLE